MIKRIKAEPVWGDAFFTDGDLESLLNLLPRYSSIEKIPGLGAVYRRLFPKNQYYSYHMETLSEPSAYRPNVFLIGGSFNFSWILMVYGTGSWTDHGEKAVFGETYFSWYHSYIRKYPEDIVASEETTDFQSIMDNDILIVEFNEQTISPNAVQFAFVENLLNYINTAQE